MRSLHPTNLILFFLLFMAGPGHSQNYFKLLADSEQYYDLKIAHFPGGDLLMADSYLAAQRTGKNGQVFVTRIDPCGNVEWSFSYGRAEEYLELKDLVINDAEEIFLYGSAYIGLDELIFLLKLNRRGGVEQFRIFEQETVDHFTYSLDLKDNQLLIYGLLLGFNTQKQGFVALFNEKLTFLWGKKFAPFESVGDAMITNDHGFICRSGSYHYKLSATGDLQWATTLDPTPGPKPVAGPVEVGDGYIFQAFHENIGFFYKLDRNGRLVWKTDQFSCTKDPAGLQILSDGLLLAVYNSPGAGENFLAQMLLSPDGAIMQQKKLKIGLPLQSSHVYPSAGKNQTIAIAGNADQLGPNAGSRSDFILQYTQQMSQEECFSWETFQTTAPNNQTTIFTPFDTTILPTNMQMLDLGTVSVKAFEPPLSDFCNLSPALALVQTDTLLPCGEDWWVSLPSGNFAWEDNSRENPRLLSDPGVYQAKSKNCDQSVVYEYILQKPPCACQVFLPNAFSPNQDGRNDRLEFFSDCLLTEQKMSVYNRWGAKIFESKLPGSTWDGTRRGKPAPSGVYLVVVQYLWLDPDGNSNEGSLAQDVLLLR